MLAASVVALGGPAMVTAALFMVLAAHAVIGFPRVPTPLVCAPNGVWALPELGMAGLRLARGTGWGSDWVELALVGPGGRRRVLLLCDQLAAEDWRRLQVAVREAELGAAGFAAPPRSDDSRPG